jgi:hypothetical protein
MRRWRQGGVASWDSEAGWLLWFVWFVSFVWLNQTNQIDQINQINHNRYRSVIRSLAKV